MAVLGAITLNEITLYEVSADPRVSTVEASIGSVAFETNTGNVFTKTGAGAADWSPILPSSTANDINIAIAGSTTTTSTAYVLMAGLTNTPAAGSYEAFFHTSLQVTSGNASVFASLYVGGTQVTTSELQMTRGGGPSDVTTPVAFSSIPITVNGSQAVEIRWRVTGGTGTAAPSRALFLRRVG